MAKLIPLSQLKLTESECHCETCAAMCSHPCWPTPLEAFELMAAGHGLRMQADYWCGDSRLKDSVTGGDVYVIGPASTGHEGRLAPHYPHTCTFHHGGLCALHGTGLKPLEGRVTKGCEVQEHDEHLHLAVANEWNSDDGRAVVALWEELVRANRKDD